MWPWLSFTSHLEVSQQLLFFGVYYFRNWGPVSAHVGICRPSALLSVECQHSHGSAATSCVWGKIGTVSSVHFLSKRLSERLFVLLFAGCHVYACLNLVTYTVHDIACSHVSPQLWSLHIWVWSGLHRACILPERTRQLHLLLFTLTSACLSAHLSIFLLRFLSFASIPRRTSWVSPQVWHERVKRSIRFFFK